MSSDVLKFNKKLCRCCHSEGKFKNIYSPQYEMDVEVNSKKMCVTPFVYADIIRECYNIELLPVMEPYQQIVSTICDSCIIKLKDANIFKEQVLRCEAEFQRRYYEHMEKDFDVKLNIKQEISERKVYGDVEDTVPHDDSGDHININIQEDVIADTKVKIEVTDISYKPKRQCKTTKTKLRAAHNAKPKRKVRRPSKTPAPTKEDEVLDVQKDINATSKLETDKSKRSKTKIKVKIKGKHTKMARTKPGEEANLVKGQIKVFRSRLFFMRENIDYKKVGDLVQCCRCELTTSNRNNLRHHVKFKHLNYSRYTCPICSGKFTNPSSFARHKFLEHNIDDRSTCNACDRKFYSKNQLNNHISCFHMLGEKNKCTDCDYETYSVDRLRRHMTKHEAVKDFHCKYCQKSFLRKSTLDVHERIHTGDKRKVCKVCGDAFVQKASLNYHMARYHPGVDF